MTKRTWLIFLLIGVFACLAGAALYNFPPVHERLAWRVESLRVRVQRAINPPEQIVFIPQKASGSLEVVATSPLPTPTITKTIPAATPTQPSTPIPSPTPIPGVVNLSGVFHEYQQFNNCGPTTLAMALAYWGWQGDQRDTRAALRPSFATIDDKNVNPWEMAVFAEEQAGYSAANRVGGDLGMLKKLVAAGFPVVVEIGIQHQPKDWMGHYLLITGYDDENGRFVTQDSLVGPDLPVKYEEIAAGWRAFNHSYLVVFPPERQAEVLSILGDQADEEVNLRSAAQKAIAEIGGLSGREQYFAWYNLGSSLTALGDYVGAAGAFDQAFNVYPTIPEDDRPWRMIWYQAAPLEAYFNTGRFDDVISLGNQALDSAGGPLLEEAFYWLGRAREASGDLGKAIYDYDKAVEINPNSTPARQELIRLGY